MNADGVVQLEDLTRMKAGEELHFEERREWARAVVPFRLIPLLFI
jgi:hypothetical protein